VSKRASRSSANGRLDKTRSTGGQPRQRETNNRAQKRTEHIEIVVDQPTPVDNITECESSPRSVYLERVPIRKRGEIVILQTAQIASVVADGEWLALTTTKNERHTMVYRLKDLESRLDPARFVRLGRGTLANVDLITKVQVTPGGRTHVALLTNGDHLPISRLQWRTLKERLLRL
jgi:two-component system LytT family response regulator